MHIGVKRSLYILTRFMNPDFHEHLVSLVSYVHRRSQLDIDIFYKKCILVKHAAIFFAMVYHMCLV